jgi:hypothetical protein
VALAILEPILSDASGVRFTIDTGTNRYYQLKVGRSVGRRSGLDWIDDVVLTTPMAVNPKGGGLMDSRTEILVPLQHVEGDRAYAQLFSFKTRDGRSPAFSPVIRIQPLPNLTGSDLFEAMSREMQTVITNPPTAFQPPRQIPCRTYAEEFSGPLLGDLLSQIVKVAAPIVVNLLGGAGAPGTTVTGPGAAAGGTAANGHAAAGQSPGLDGLAALLVNLFRAIPGLATPASIAAGVSGAQSVASGERGGNRFLGSGNGQLSRPFIFGIDDAIIGALVGQVVQVLPQLMNSANQGRIQLKQANNKLITDILGGINQRLLLQQVTQAQAQAQANAQPVSADLAQLAQLLQQLPPAAMAGDGAPAAGAVAQSLSTDPASGTVSARAVLAFVMGDPVPWNGSNRVLFAKNQPIQLRVRLVVAEPAPKSPLPKAILRVLFKDADQSVLHETTVRQKDVAANGTISVPIDAAALARLPAHKPIAVLAELRWLGSTGSREYKALGSTEITLVDRYFVKERGPTVGPEVELTDMNRYRPFWNKIWEAPTLDSTKGSAKRKYLWEFDVNAKYSVLLSPDHDANGLMETKVLRAAKDRESLVDRTQGRMKAGIELSVAELNKLAALWDGSAPLDEPRLDAFRTPEFARANGKEVVSHFKLKGRAAERGMVWVIPVFQRAEFTLASVERTDDAGQVVTIADEKVRFPLPVAVRAIGLKSKQ